LGVIAVPTIHGKKDSHQSLKTEELPLTMILQLPEYGTGLSLSRHAPLQLNSQVVVMFDRGEIYNPIIIGRLETFSETVDETQSNNVEVSKDPVGNTIKKTFIQGPNQKGTIETLSVMNSAVHKNVVGDSLTITQDLENNIGTITAVLNSGVNVTLNKDFVLVENENASITISKDLSIAIQGNVSISIGGNADIGASGNVNISGAIINLN
jgi:hypothetical protein